MTSMIYTVPDVYSWQRDKVTTVRGGLRTHRPKGDATAKAAHRNAAIKARPRGWSIDSFCRAWVIYTPPDRRARDVDRVGSLVLDALTGVLWRDDSDRYVSLVTPSPHDEWLLWYAGAHAYRLGHPLVRAKGTTLVLVERIGAAIPTQAEEREKRRAEKRTKRTEAA